MNPSAVTTLPKNKVSSAANLVLPDGYAEHRLGLKLHPKQKAVLRSLFPIGKKSRVSLRKANEVGGTRTVIAAAVLYAIEILGAEVISTAGKWQQVATQLIPSLKRFESLFPRNWEFQDTGIKVNGRFRYIGFSTTSGFAQGFHKTEGSPLVGIIDEAGLVEKGIFDDIEDRCNPDYFLCAGAPMNPEGAFYDIETKLAKFYTHHHISQMDCLKTDGYWIDPQDIERKIAKYGGKDHPFIQSNIYGEFSKRVENALLSLSEFNACLASPPDFLALSDEVRGFVDVAGGTDKNVFAVRKGNKIWIEKKWIESSEMATCGEIVAIIQKLKGIGLKPENVGIDASGAGKPMADRLREMGFNLERFVGQAAPKYDFDYSNAISEAWGLLAAKIKACDIIIPSDEDFMAQMLSRPLKRNSSGKFQIQPKEEYCKNHASPDEADAIAGVCLPCNTTNKSFNLSGLTETQESRGWIARARDEQADNVRDESMIGNEPDWF